MNKFIVKVSAFFLIGMSFSCFAGKVTDAVIKGLEISKFRELVNRNCEDRKDLGLAFRNAIHRKKLEHAFVLLRHDDDGDILNSQGAKSGLTAMCRAIINNDLDSATFLMTNKRHVRLDLPSLRKVKELVAKLPGGLSKKNPMYELLKLDSEKCLASNASPLRQFVAAQRNLMEIFERGEINVESAQQAEARNMEQLRTSGQPLYFFPLGQQ